jgi:hypothetical protein
MHKKLLEWCRKTTVKINPRFYIEYVLRDYGLIVVNSENVIVWAQSKITFREVVSELESADS